MRLANHILMHRIAIFLRRGTREAHHAAILQDAAKNDVLKDNMLSWRHVSQGQAKHRRNAHQAHDKHHNTCGT